MELRFIGFILLIHTSYICRGEDPGPPSCTNDKPFRLSDSTCANFTDICLKNDNQCKDFQSACKQCPPSNYSVIMYIDIINLKNQLNITNKNLEDLRNKFLLISNRSPEQTNNILILCSIILALLITLNLLFIIEYRFKIITKCCQKLNQKESRYNKISQSRKKTDNDELMEKINKLEKLQNEFQETQKKNHQELIDQFKKYQMFLSGTQINSELTSNDIKFATIQFQFDGIDQEPIELYVYNYHNIVQVKQLICAKLPHAKPEDYKIMKLKYKRNILNDNHYLLEHIDKSNAIVNCFIDSSKNASDIVVVKLQGKIPLPEIIQINKNQTIDQLKELIGKIIKSKEFSLFKEINNKKEYRLLNSDTIKELKDRNLILVILEQKGKLVIKSIFDDNTSISIDYVNTDTILTVIEKIQNKFNSNKDNYILFYKNEPVEESKYIFEFDFSDEFAFKMCNIAKFHGIKNGNNKIEIGGFWELSYAIDTANNNNILLKKYNNIDLKNWKTKEIILNELKLFTKTKLKSRFIQLTGIYINGTALYVAMEHMAGGTLKYYLKQNKNEQEIAGWIAKWITQIVEGLKFLHHIKIIHRDLNPSNILVDKNIDLKLSSFNLSKYEQECNMSSVNEKEYIGQIKVRYMAPELLAGESYGVSCDIWSLGAVLVRVVSGKCPFRDDTKEGIISKVKNGDMKDIKFPNENRFKPLIDSCLKRNPEDRCTLDDLLKSIN